MSALIVWGPELSPFLLKLESMLAAGGLEFRRLPRDGTRLENIRVSSLIARARRTRSALRPPRNDDLDEYPLVPYLLTPAGDVLYDSSALAGWLDQAQPQPSRRLIPDDAALAFAVHLVDEAFDEFGLYLVHHNRWKLAALDNDQPGLRLAREYARLLPPGGSRVFGGWFARRQVRRLPYLFSVAPAGYREPGLVASRTPPSRAGFPPTHELLETAWQRHLAALEAALADSAFLFGDRFTLADASVYGQLSMNLTDTAAARRMRELAPRTWSWLSDIRDRKHAGAAGMVAVRAETAPLLGVILETFVPLMRANEAAWQRLRQSGETVFNEKAFDAGRSLYDGEILGHPFRSVAKTFQVRVWRDLRERWRLLSLQDRARLGALAPGHDLEKVLGPEPS